MRVPGGNIRALAGPRLTASIASVIEQIPERTSTGRPRTALALEEGGHTREAMSMLRAFGIAHNREGD